MKIPRIKGLTKLIQHYNLTYNEPIYYKAINLIVEHYINNGFTILGVPLSLSELSELYNVSEQTFQDQVLKTSNLFNSAFRSSKIEEIQDLRAKIFSLILQASLRDKTYLERAISLIMSDLAYENSGKPKLPTLNSLYKSLEISDKIDSRLLKLVETHSGTPNMLYALIQQPIEAQKQTLTAQEATELIGNMAQRLLEDPDHMARLAQKHGLDQAPEVRATEAVETSYVPDTSLIPENLDTIHYSIED